MTSLSWTLSSKPYLYAGLLSALYVKDGEETPSPDPASGLYISNRNGISVKAPIPESHIAFQMGEAMQASLIACR